MTGPEYPSDDALTGGPVDGLPPNHGEYTGGGGGGSALIAAEADARAAADTSEAGTRAAADTAEASTRAAADIAETSDITSETAARIAADNVLAAYATPKLTSIVAVTTTYTANPNELIPADATSASFTVSLPTAPTDGTRIIVKKIDTSTNVVTVACQGSDVLNKTGGSTSIGLSLTNQAITLQYAHALGIWYITADDFSLSTLDKRFSPISGTPKQPLVIDGTHVREGVGGPIYRAVGYNMHVIPGVYPSYMTLDTQAKLDDFFSKQPPNSLHRTFAYAPGSGSGHTDASTLTILSNLIATARKFGQRLILRTTNWTTVGSTPGVVDRFDNKSSTWFTSQTYKHSVSGSTSYEDWVIALLGICGTDGTVSAIDLLNEPVCSSGNAASAATYVSYMSGVIKAINPNMLVYMGINLAATVGGTASYQTIMASADFCCSHNYNPYGWPTGNDPVLICAKALAKPLIYDEFGMLAKGQYGLSTDTDKDSQGRPGVDFEAQGQEIKQFLASTFAYDFVFGNLLWSWPATQTDGLAHYEPPEGSPGRKVMLEADLDGERFTFDTLPSISSWLDGASNFLTAPGTSLTSWQRRDSNGVTGSIAGGTAPTSGRFGDFGSFRFKGATQLIDTTSFKTGAAAMTGFWAFVPTIWPATSSYAYLTGPQISTNNASAVRINSAGQIEVIRTATGGSNNGTVECTSTNSVNRDAINILAYRWDTATGVVTIKLNGILTTATVGAVTLTLGNARLACGYDGVNGFVGHILEIIQEQIAETDTNIGLTTAYMDRKYRLIRHTGSGHDYTDQQVAAVLASVSAWHAPAAITAAGTPATNNDFLLLDTTGGTFAQTFTFSTGSRYRLKWVAGTAAPTLTTTGRTLDPTFGGFGSLGDAVEFYDDGTNLWAV